MKRLLLAISIALLSLSSTAVLAQGHGGDKHGNAAGHDQRRGESRQKNQRGHHGQGRGESDRNAGWAQAPRRGNFDKHGHRRAYAYGYAPHHDNGRHLGQYKFRRGQRLPAFYRQQRYYVQDYRYYNLAPPPYGYRWVRVENDRYLLTSIATGLISQILGY